MLFSEKTVSLTNLEIEERKKSKLLKFLSYFGGPISYLLEIACIICIITKDWIDLGILLFVLIANAIIGYSEEAKAEDALDALKSSLAIKAKAIRDGHLQEVHVTSLVPGDVIAMRIGDIVPADCK